MKKASLSLKQYVLYFLVGGFIGASAVLLREIFSYFTADTRAFYLLSVLFVYIVAMTAGYYLHNSITFRGSITRTGDQVARRFPHFVGVAIAGAILTGLLSVGIRYGLDLDSLFHQYAGTVAFVIAALISSVATYVLNAYLVFHEPQHTTSNKPLQ